MRYLLLSLLLLPLSVLAESPTNYLTPQEVCAAVEYELNEAVKFGIINEQEAKDIALRCWVNYSALPLTSGSVA